MCCLKTVQSACFSIEIRLCFLEKVVPSRKLQKHCFAKKGSIGKRPTFSATMVHLGPVRLLGIFGPWKTLTSLNYKESRLSFPRQKSFGVFPLFLLLAITAFGGLKAILTCDHSTWSIIVPKYYYRFGKMEMRSLDSLI